MVLKIIATYLFIDLTLQCDNNFDIWKQYCKNRITANKKHTPWGYIFLLRLSPFLSSSFLFSCAPHPSFFPMNDPGTMSKFLRYHLFAWLSGHVFAILVFFSLWLKFPTYAIFFHTPYLGFLEKPPIERCRVLKRPAKWPQDAEAAVLLEHRKGTQASGEELENLPEDTAEPHVLTLMSLHHPSTGTAPYCAGGRGRDVWTGSSPRLLQSRDWGWLWTPDRKLITSWFIHNPQVFPQPRLLATALQPCRGRNPHCPMSLQKPWHS